jgi:imidazolonepropionase-like amidohydrolase
MATCRGARALGWPGRVGELEPGCLADMVALPYDGPLAEAAAAVVHHPGPVSASMIDGEWAVAPSRI